MEESKDKLNKSEIDLDVEIKTYKISYDTKLNKIISDQLLVHRDVGDKDFSLPDPTIAKLGETETEYLIITDISDNMPSVCFYKLEANIS